MRKFLFFILALSILFFCYRNTIIWELDKRVFLKDGNGKVIKIPIYCNKNDTSVYLIYFNDNDFSQIVINRKTYELSIHREGEAKDHYYQIGNNLLLESRHSYEDLVCQHSAKFDDIVTQCYFTDTTVVFNVERALKNKFGQTITLFVPLMH